MKISIGAGGSGGGGGGDDNELAAAASQDAMLLHEKYLNHNKHQRKESYVTTTTCLSFASAPSKRELTAAAAAIMPAATDDVTGERIISTHTQSSGVDNDNKWSHNQQISKINSSASSRPQMFQHQRQRSVSSSSSIAHLILSILIGMSLAAIHTSALTGGGGGQSGSPASSAPSSNQQMGSGGGVASTASSSSDNSAGLGETSGRSYLQPPPVTTKPQTAINLADQSPAINLIPIDQPVSTVGTTATANSGHLGPVAPPGGSQTNNNFRPPKDSYDGSSINLRSSMVSPSQESGANSASPSSSSSSASASASAQQADDFSSGSQFAQQSEDEFSEPIAQFYTNEGLPAETAAAYQTIIEQQQPAQQQQQQEKQPPMDQVKSTSGPQLAAPRQSVERRFGLFKKGQHHFGSGQQQQHYGLPSMSANYASGPYMSDCERCLASFGQQQTADLQQLDPPASLPPSPPSLPPPAVLPVMPSLPSFGVGGGHYPMQPFGPLKSKFFMKFPFLVKPSPFGNGGGDSGGQQHSYWPMSSPVASYQPSQSSYHHHHHQRPSSSPGGMSQALFIRPAPAYNCIQASPPLLQAAAASTSSASYTTSQAEVGGSKTSPVASGKQLHYGGGHHHQQQQQVQGYASKK